MSGTMVEDGSPLGSLSLPGLLRLLQLASPGLPVGGFAYSQGLEPAVCAGWVRDEATAGDWMSGLLQHSLRGLEVPLLGRLHAAWTASDDAAVSRWNDFLYAARPSRELQEEDRRLGAALARVLSTVGISAAAAFRDHSRVTHIAMFALACSTWHIPLLPAAAAFLFTWAENQVGAAVRLMALGQSAGQRILSRLGQEIPSVVAAGLLLADADIGQGAPGLALASAWHEKQYSRIFRS